jgi:hypothetical protein
VIKIEARATRDLLLGIVEVYLLLFQFIRKWPTVDK